MINIKEINLKHFTKTELAEIYNTLNGWEWHKTLGEKPEEWDSLDDYEYFKFENISTKRNIIEPYMQHIKQLIGDKECLKWLHINELKRSRLQFEIWWIKRLFRKLFGVSRS